METALEAAGLALTGFVSVGFHEPLNQTDMDAETIGIGTALLQRRPKTMAQTAP